MLSKCANPICVAPFRYLREGRIFNVEVRKASAQGQIKIEHFWLCDICSKTLKVVCIDGFVTISPLHLSLPAAKVQEIPDLKRNVA